MKLNSSTLQISKLKLENLDKYLSFELNVKAHMEHPEWLGPFTKEDYENLLSNNSYIFIWTLNDEIIASGMLIPTRQEDLGKFFSGELNYQEVLDFGPEMVNPNYVGNGLQQIVINYLSDFSKTLGYKYALATVHPDNVYSINNFIKTNFKELGEVEFKRGKRIIFRKQIY